LDHGVRFRRDYIPGKQPTPTYLALVIANLIGLVSHASEAMGLPTQEEVEDSHRPNTEQQEVEEIEEQIQLGVTEQLDSNHDCVPFFFFFFLGGLGYCVTFQRSASNGMG